MINNKNFVELEGKIFHTPEVKETEGKKVVNFAVCNERHTSHGTDMRIYNCVAWNVVAEKFGEDLKEGLFVRITGHLQANTLQLESGDIFHYSKVCVDNIEF
jgi:single-stranded DNA-binding protein